MATIVSIGTAVPPFQHNQSSILSFMQGVFQLDETEKRKLKYLYQQSHIATRHSVIADFSLPKGEWTFIPQDPALPFPPLEKRMDLYENASLPLSLDAINNCLGNQWLPNEITHLITVSCTGMSAPGLDLQIAQALHLPPTVFRTSVNFMGCYAAVHALRIASLLVNEAPSAKVMVVCTELCTLHFQKAYTADNVSSSLLFSDGSAAALVVSDVAGTKGVQLQSFYSEIATKGQADMSWKLSSEGFLMSLSSYVADIIKTDIEAIFQRSAAKTGYKLEEIDQWCIHPGGRKILEAVEKAISIPATALQPSYNVLADYGNMSSPTLLFVLKEMMTKVTEGERIMACAFGPGLTIETFVAIAKA